MTQRKAAAKDSGVSGGVVNRQMRKLWELLENDRPLRRLVEQAKVHLENTRQSMRNPQGKIEGAK